MRELVLHGWELNFAQILILLLGILQLKNLIYPHRQDDLYSIILLDVQRYEVFHEKEILLLKPYDIPPLKIQNLPNT
jgi:hypothetical protein